MVNPGDPFRVGIEVNSELVPEGYKPLSYQWVKGNGSAAALPFPFTH